MGKFKDTIGLCVHAIDEVRRTPTTSDVEALVNALSDVERTFDKKLDAFFMVVDEVKSLVKNEPDSPQKTAYIDGLDAILYAVGELEKVKGYLHKAPYIYFGEGKTSPMLEDLKAMEREEAAPLVSELMEHVTNEASPVVGAGGYRIESELDRYKAELARFEAELEAAKMADDVSMVKVLECHVDGLKDTIKKFEAV